MTEQMSKKWYTVTEAAAIIGITPRALRGRLMRNPKLGRETMTARGKVWEISATVLATLKRNPAGRKSGEAWKGEK